MAGREGVGWKYYTPPLLSIAEVKLALDRLVTASGPANAGPATVGGVRTGTTGRKVALTTLQADPLGMLNEWVDCVTGNPIPLWAACLDGDSIQCSPLSLFDVPDRLDEPGVFEDLIPLMEELNAVYDRFRERAETRARAHPHLKDFELTITPTARGLRLTWCKPGPGRDEQPPVRKLKMTIRPRDSARRRRRHDRALEKLLEQLKPCVLEKMRKAASGAGAGKRRTR